MCVFFFLNLLFLRRSIRATLRKIYYYEIKVISNVNNVII